MSKNHRKSNNEDLMKKYDRIIPDSWIYENVWNEEWIKDGLSDYLPPCKQIGGNKYVVELNECENEIDDYEFFESTFHLSDTGNVLRVESVGPGRSLLSINHRRRILAIGCAYGIYILRTVDFHFLMTGLSGLTNLFEVSDPKIIIQNPLQIKFCEFNDDILFVRNVEGIFLFKIKSDSSITCTGYGFHHYAEEYGRIIGDFKLFEASSSGFLAVLSRENEVYICSSKMSKLNVSTKKHHLQPERILSSHRVSWITFSPNGNELSLCTLEGKFLIVNLRKNSAVVARFELPGHQRRNLTPCKWLSETSILFTCTKEPLGIYMTPASMSFTIREREFSSQSTTKDKITTYELPKLQIYENTCLRKGHPSEMFIKYLDDWGTLLFYSVKNRGKLEILEEDSSGNMVEVCWDGQAGHLAKKNKVIRNLSSEGCQCAGFEVDITMRYDFCNKEMSPHLVVLLADGTIIMKKLEDKDKSFIDEGRSYPLNAKSDEQMYIYERFDEIFANLFERLSTGDGKLSIEWTNHIVRGMRKGIQVVWVNEDEYEDERVRFLCDQKDIENDDIVSLDRIPTGQSPTLRRVKRERRRCLFMYKNVECELFVVDVRFSNGLVFKNVFKSFLCL